MTSLETGTQESKWLRYCLRMTKILGLSFNFTTRLFVDCTFSICPAGFSQCLIFMIYEDSTHLYIPIFYVLLQSKHEVTYKEAVHQIIRATEYQIGASSITCDFEIGLYNAIHCYFPQATPRASSTFTES